MTPLLATANPTGLPPILRPTARARLRAKLQHGIMQINGFLADFRGFLREADFLEAEDPNPQRSFRSWSTSKF